MSVMPNWYAAGLHAATEVGGVPAVRMGTYANPTDDPLFDSPYSCKWDGLIYGTKYHITVNLAFFEKSSRYRADSWINTYTFLHESMNDVTAHIAQSMFDDEHYNVKDDQRALDKIIRQHCDFQHVYGLYWVTITSDKLVGNGLGRDGQFFFIYNWHTDNIVLHLAVDKREAYTSEDTSVLIKIVLNRTFAKFYGLTSEQVQAIEDEFNTELVKILKIIKSKSSDATAPLIISAKPVSLPCEIGTMWMPTMILDGLNSYCYLRKMVHEELKKIEEKADKKTLSDKNNHVKSELRIQEKNKFVVGNKYMLKFKALEKKDSIKKVYVLKKFVYSMQDEPLNILIMKQIDGPVSNSLFTLSKKDCERIHLKFEAGLQVFPMGMNWINLTKTKHNGKIHQTPSSNK